MLLNTLIISISRLYTVSNHCNGIKKDQIGKQKAAVIYMLEEHNTVNISYASAIHHCSCKYINQKSNPCLKINHCFTIKKTVNSKNYQRTACDKKSEQCLQLFLSPTKCPLPVRALPWKLCPLPG